MCGIAGIALKRENSLDISSTILSMSSAIVHRGPDGEGFMLANEATTEPFASPAFNLPSKKEIKYLPEKKINGNTFPRPRIGFAHRRLSIIDLSESGHQPMCSNDKKIWITYNGEIYNYLELKKELENLGCTFFSSSDTEVIIEAYKQWGQECVTHFNGMWAFCIYDVDKQIFFASRDRLGVKPFYFVDDPAYFAFASEQKAFVKSGLIKAYSNTESLYNYLINGLLETRYENFFENVEELFPGHNLVYKISSGESSIYKYYGIQITDANEKRNDKELIEEIRNKVWNAVKIRLRSDVEVGACLSGGIDSSVICTVMARSITKPIHTFTSVFRNESFNEEYYADIVSKKIQSIHLKVQPTEEAFVREIDDLVYSQDVPIWDTSTYAQYKVMELAKLNGIKVVIDGQGADEMFAGYHHHFVAKWNNIRKNNGVMKMIKEISSSGKTISLPFVFYAKELLKQNINLQASLHNRIFTKSFVMADIANASATYFNSVNEQLINDIEKARLKSFLKCEDRCGMWHSVESRTPFSDDVELINLMFSFNGNRKIQNGISKYLLREAAKDVLPAEIYSRYDKKGFETPMQKWVTNLKPMMVSEINNASFPFLKKGQVENLDMKKPAEVKLLFKLFILTRWQKVFA